MNDVVRMLFGKPTHSLADYVRGRENNYNLIRLIAAATVLYAHSFPLVGSREFREPIKMFFESQTKPGWMAVEIFFFTSGLLVTASLLRWGSLKTYSKARFLRIFPAYAFCIFFCVFIVGPLFTSYSVTQYFSEAMPYKYLYENLVFDTRHEIVGVFDDHAYNSINGSLWTLPLEVKAYIILGLIGATGVFAHRIKSNVVIVALFVLMGMLSYNVSPHFDMKVDDARVWAYFLLGSACYINRDRIPLDGRILCILLAGSILTDGTSLFLYAWGLFLAYATLLLAYRAPYSKFNEIGDYSYGLYIYAWPMQQCVVSLFPHFTPYQNMMLAFPLALGLAFLSWHMIEKKALRLKNVPVSEWGGLLRRKLTLRLAD